MVYSWLPLSQSGYALADIPVRVQQITCQTLETWWQTPQPSAGFVGDLRLSRTLRSSSRELTRLGNLVESHLWRLSVVRHHHVNVHLRSVLNLFPRPASNISFSHTRDFNLASFEPLRSAILAFDNALYSLFLLLVNLSIFLI